MSLFGHLVRVDLVNGRTVLVRRATIVAVAGEADAHGARTLYLAGGHTFDMADTPENLERVFHRRAANAPTARGRQASTDLRWQPFNGTKPRDGARAR